MFCDIFHLAIITLGWPFEHIVKSTKSFGMGQTNPLFCNARVLKMFVQTILPFPPLQSEAILVVFLLFSGQVCSCLMIRRTSQRMSLVPSLFFCLLWLLCLLICISSIYHSAMYLVHFDLSTYTRLKYIHFGYLWKNFVQCTWLIYTLVHPYIYILNLVHLYLNVQVCYFAWSLRDSLWLAFSRRR